MKELVSLLELYDLNRFIAPDGQSPSVALQNTRCHGLLLIINPIIHVFIDICIQLVVMQFEWPFEDRIWALPLATFLTWLLFIFMHFML